jgi:hypothetical protein
MRLERIPVAAGLIAVFSCCPIPAVEMSMEPAAHWEMDVVSQGRTPEVQGRFPGMLHGEITGGVRDVGSRDTDALAPGVVGRALRLNARAYATGQDHIVIENSAGLGFADATFSIAIWVNAYRLGRGQQMLVGKNDYAAGHRQWGLMLDNDDRFALYVRDPEGTWQSLRSVTKPIPGHWTHVAAAVDRGHACLYINAAREAEADFAATIPDSPAPVTIGAIVSGGEPMQTFVGALDEVMLFDAPLPPDTVRRLADQRPPPHEILLTEPEGYPLWGGVGPVPETRALNAVAGVEFSVIKPYRFAEDGYRFHHGVALAWHRDRLYASIGVNREGENLPGEEAVFTVSHDAGRSWTDLRVIEAGSVDENTAVSHGVFLSRDGELWAFHGAFTDFPRQGQHVRVYRLDETADRWECRAHVLDGFWPLQEPLRMTDGNWIMAGIHVGEGNPAAVAVSHGNDLTRWDEVVIPKADGEMWGESTVLVSGRRVLNIARYHTRPVAVAAVSEDSGRTWTPSVPSNLPMAGSKPYAGTLSTGQHYLVSSNTTGDGTGHRRSPLTIAVTRPGEEAFSRVFVIRDAEFPAGPGESHPNAALAYPYAVEYAGNLYVGYSNSGGGVGRVGEGRQLWNSNSIELAVIPVDSLLDP